MSHVRPIRKRSGTKTVIAFIHGFGGDPSSTWQRFPTFLLQTRQLKNWDIWSIGYDTSLYPDIRGIWTADPGIKLLSPYLRTACQHQLGQYERIVFVAHSMGGLVVQRALIDYADELVPRTHAVFLFGTPSNGLVKARLFWILKLSLQNMGAGSTFIRDLRERWDKQFPGGDLPFQLWTIAGSRDVFVPESSSHDPFPMARRYCVPGGHTSMVKPQSKDDPGVRIVQQGIVGKAAKGAWTADLAALEEGKFQAAIRHWLPRAKELDDDHLVTLALALDATGRRDKAIEILEARRNLGTDALGTLAGRYKRIWLQDGTKSSAEKALKLYGKGLRVARGAGDHDQMHYHAINLAFLELLYCKRLGASVTNAEQALEACGKAKPSAWRSASMGEAALHLGNASAARRAYAEVMSFNPPPRAVESIMEQAFLVNSARETLKPEKLARIFQTQDE